MSLSNFFHELSVLKILPRSGSFTAGVKNPDTIGEHVFRASQISFILAELENANSEHSCFLTTIHDNAESRIGDLNKIQTLYISDKKESEQKAFFDQIKNFPEKIKKKYFKAFNEFEENKTIEAKCSRDADLLECAFQAKEFLEQGYKLKQEWINNVGNALQTKSAKKIFNEMNNSSCHDWWKEVRKNN